MHAYKSSTTTLKAELLVSRLDCNYHNEICGPLQFMGLSDLQDPLSLATGLNLRIWRVDNTQQKRW